MTTWGYPGRKDQRARRCAIGALLFAVSLVFMSAAQGASQKSYLRDGYFLLHFVSDQESKVDMLFMFKDAPPDYSDLAKRLSQAGKDTLTALDQFKEADKSIAWEENPLPPVEIDVRASIKADKQHMLLFGTKGADFQRAFLVSQIEASTYASNLAKVLADHESNSARAQTLRRLSAKWLALRVEAYRMLR